ncbi:MAG: site-specific integrase [Proteobacteria bacterium]|nr:site-specific integrase [Pseudomonadota bacterium]
MKIDKNAINRLMESDVGAVIRDGNLIDFQARRIKTGITFHYEYRAGSGRRAPVRRLKIGKLSDALTPEQARILAKSFSLQVSAGRDPALERGHSKTVPTLEQFADEILNKAEETARTHPSSEKLTIRTIQGYQSMMRNHIRPALGKRRLDQIAQADVTRLHDTVTKTHPTTANKCLQLISSLYGKAAKLGHIARDFNPAKGIDKNKEHLRETFLSEVQLEALGTAIAIAQTEGIAVTPQAKPGRKAKHIPKSHPPYIISANAADAIRLLVLIGCRLRELIEAKWTQLDLERGTLTRMTKTGRRHIMIPAAAIAILEAMPRCGPYIFPQDTNPAKPKSDLAKQWRAVCKIAGFTGIRLHDLWHSFARSC